MHQSHIRESHSVYNVALLHVSKVSYNGVNSRLRLQTCSVFLA